MTWMDAVVDGKPVTGRDGYQVEINALWYNAICYTLELARKHRDNAFVHEWKEVPTGSKRHSTNCSGIRKRSISPTM